MNIKSIAWLVVAIAVLIGAYWLLSSQRMSATDASAAPSAETTASSAAQETQPAEGTAVYSYECDEHVTFDMLMTADVGSIRIMSTQAGVYPPLTLLEKVESESGARYEGGGFVFFGKGESVTLTEGGQSLNCSPVASQDSAPFNFGD
jgi:membrane-bound inhibitor of C-type lysozyme